MKLFTLVGFGVCSLVAVGVMNWVSDMAEGTSSPEDLPVHVNNEFGDVGLVVPVEPGGSGRVTDPFGSVPGAGYSPPPGSGYGR